MKRSIKVRKNKIVAVLAAGTSFQRAVWKQILKIPNGRTKTYKEIANILGKPRACRAVGQACKQNPLPVIIPCHRVVGKGGKLGGYSGGIKRKKALLQREKDGQ